ncbi:MAG: Hsp70 family protein [Kiritimatiellae bacterium]|jgi:molecular chaperone DnaK|nr:Hsp70 family protein [Kiritimatiellia bacterium]
MSRIAGIDLGTTFSAISYLNKMGRPEIIPNADGERIMHSAVYFESASNILVGVEAVNSRHEDVSKSVRWIKSHMSDEEYKVTIDGAEYTPADISALILKKLHQGAQQQIGVFSDVVITVPANFGEVARKATMDAGKIAGLNVVGIVNEPTAAAIYYVITQEVKGHVLVFDLGGGTFDVSIADVNGKNVEIVTSSGDRHLGGINFDEKLVEYFEKNYKEKSGGNLYSSQEERSEVEDYAELIKRSLSKKESVAFRLKGDSGTVRGELTQSEFNVMISSFLARMEMLVETALDDAGNEPSDIDKVLLVGGSSRIPAVQDMLKNIFGFEPTVVGNVDECVSLGAALYAGLRLLEDDPSRVDEGIAAGLCDVNLGEVCNHGYGTICLSFDEVTQSSVLTNDVLIKKDSKIPCAVKQIFCTHCNNQQIIKAKLTAGMSSDPDECIVLVSGELKLPPGLPERTPIEVSYSYDKDQRMRCVFEHKDSGTQLVFDYDVMSRKSSSQTIAEKKAKIEDFTIE